MKVSSFFWSFRRHFLCRLGYSFFTLKDTTLFRIKMVYFRFKDSRQKNAALPSLNFLVNKRKNYSHTSVIHTIRFQKSDWEAKTISAPSGVNIYKIIKGPIMARPHCKSPGQIGRAVWLSNLNTHMWTISRAALSTQTRPIGFVIQFS